VTVRGDGGRRRPAGANNFLKWRRSIIEHLELRRITWHEFGMFTWLCTKASPQTGTVRTSWPTLARETGLSPDHVEQICRGLKRKRYIWYPPHRGTRDRLIELAIDKFPTVDGGFTDLSARFRPGAAPLPGIGRPPDAPQAGAARPTEVLPDVRTDVPTEHATGVPTDAPMDLPTEVEGGTVEESRGSPPGRTRREREEERERDVARVLRARSPRARAAQTPSPGGAVTNPEPLRAFLARYNWWPPPTDGRPTSSGPEDDREARVKPRSEPRPGGGSR
jgi:hypothetical protein